MHTSSRSHMQTHAHTALQYKYRYLFNPPHTLTLNHRSNFTDRIPFKWFKSILFRWIRQHFYTQSEEKYTNTWGPEKFEKATHPLAIMVIEMLDDVCYYKLLLWVLIAGHRKFLTMHFVIFLYSILYRLTAVIIDSFLIL